MYIDSLLLLSDAQAVTADAASTNVIDLSVAGRDISIGTPLVLAVQIDVSADITTGDETYTVIVRNSAAAALTSPTDVGQRTITAANLAAGTIHIIPLSNLVLRYVGAYYDVGGTTPTVTVTSWLTPWPFVQQQRYYASGTTIA